MAKQNAFVQFINYLLRKTSEDTIKRDLTYGSYYDMIYQQLYTIFDYPYIMEFMKAENGTDYAVVNDDGKLWKVPVTASNDEVTIGEPVQVKIDFPEVTSRGMVFRDSSGQLKFTSISSAATLNRSGDIDSRDLFDDMERNFEEYSKDAYLQFYHLGEALKFGQIRGCFRLGNLFLTYGDVDESNPLGKAAETRFAEDKWGVSIGFMPLDKPEKLALTREITVDVYKKGYLVEVSVLRESDAASYFTNIMGHKIENGVKRMADAKKVAEVLRDFLGEGSEEYIEQVLADAKVRERTIEEKKMITRSTEVEEEKEVEAEAETEVANSEIEIDDELVSKIADKVTLLLGERIEAIEARAKQTVELIENANKAVEALTLSANEITKTVEKEVETRTQNDEDKPASNKMVVRYRPTMDKLSDEKTDNTVEEIDITKFASMKRNKGKN